MACQHVPMTVAGNPRTLAIKGQRTSGIICASLSGSMVGPAGENITVIT